MIAPLGASALTSSVFGYEVAIRLEALLVAGNANTLISMEQLHTMLPPSLAQQIPERRLPAQNSSICLRMRQAAAAAGIPLIVCGNVVEVDANVFEVTASVFGRSSAENRVLEMVRGSDADSVAAKIVAQLPRFLSSDR